MASETEHTEITDCEDIRSAVEKYKKEPKNSEWERYILNRSVQLGCTEHIPDEWGIE